MKRTITNIFSWLIGICRVLAGLVVINAGYQLTQQQGMFSFWSVESSIGGIFVMLLGLAFIALAIFPKSFERSE